MKAISFIPAFIVFVISYILLVIPGNNLPQSAFFDIPYFDKYVHVSMFFSLTFLFCLPLFKLSAFNPTIISWFKKIALLVVVYGIAMEFVQKYYVIGRSFDGVDIVFDTIGSSAGFVAVKQFFIKKNRP